MRIGGIQKTTLLDFPEKVSAVIFTQGCNFCCPYCHNAAIASGMGETLDYAEVLHFLAQRKKVLAGVVISGGEPTLQPKLAAFCSTLKSMGYAVKLDTNGSNPTVIQQLLAAQLLDYVAMDVKADPRQYPKEIWPGSTGSAIVDSLALLKNSTLPHEVRIPCASPFITPANFPVILEAIHADTPIFLQAIPPKHMLNPAFFAQEGRILEQDAIRGLQSLALQAGHNCSIR